MSGDRDRRDRRVRGLLRWFAANARDLPWRRRRSLYSIWVSEIMLQQTRAETVVPYFRRFLRRFPSPGRLAAAPLQEVLKAWEGLGYYARARNLWRAAQAVVARHRGRVPGQYREFRSLPGVGEYTAAAVLSIGAGLALPVVDGNVLRVVSRWQGIDSDIRLPAAKTKVRSFLSGIIPKIDPGRFNEAMMELGALVCLAKNPLCRQCPLRPGCFAHCHGRTASLPEKSRKKPVPEYEVALAAIVRAGKVFIQLRPEQGHLGGLWELPGGKCRAGEACEDAAVRECREELGAEVEALRELAVVRHAYSHFKVRLHLFACRLQSGRMRAGSTRAWVRAEELANYPLPAANHKFMKELIHFMNGNRRKA